VSIIPVYGTFTYIVGIEPCHQINTVDFEKAQMMNNNFIVVVPQLIAKGKY